MANERDRSMQFPGPGPKVGDPVGRAGFAPPKDLHSGEAPAVQPQVPEHIRNLAVGIREEARAALADSEHLAKRLSGADSDLIRGIVARLQTVNRHIEIIADL